MKKEIWKSDNGLEEIHYFVEGKPNEYIFGYNPKYFTKEQIDMILAELP